MAHLATTTIIPASHPLGESCILARVTSLCEREEAPHTLAQPCHLPIVIMASGCEHQRGEQHTPASCTIHTPFSSCLLHVSCPAATLNTSCAFDFLLA